VQQEGAWPSTASTRQDVETRCDLRLDVSGALPEGAGQGGPVEIARTLVADPAAVAAAGRQIVVVGIPGASYHRRYWDMQPPGRSGYSMAAWLAARGAIFVACDYLGGGDSSRAADGDFMTLAACADAAHAAQRQVRAAVQQGTLAPWLPPLADPVYVGIGQSLGGLILLAEQGKYADYSAVGIFGASALEIVLPGGERAGADPDERRAAPRWRRSRRSTGRTRCRSTSPLTATMSPSSSTLLTCRMACSPTIGSSARPWRPGRPR
jgi:alpha-beta hydrolase superfamily lysophospholipase